MLPVLTLSMIVKNEEKYLRDCLESVKGVADEIVIADTGSTDKTVEIAREYGAKIISFEWINDFSAARNFALKNSTGEWILYLDADERLSSSSINELKRIVASNKLQGVNCTVKSPDDENHRPGLMRYVRLFRNSPGLAFEGSIHEQILPSLKKNNYRITESNIEIIHLGYNISSTGLKEKARRNLQLLLSEYESKKSPYYAFQLGQTYAVLCDKENAVRYFRLAAEDQRLEKSYKAQSFRFMAAYELEAGNFKEALDSIRKALQLEGSSAIINYLAAQIFLALNDIKTADNHCRKALVFNSGLKEGKRNSSFDILIDESILLYLGLNISLSNNMQGFDFYFSELKLLSAKGQKLNTVLDLISMLKDKKDPDAEMPSRITEVLNEYNTDLILNLISACDNLQNRISILTSLENKLSQNPRYLLLLGQAWLGVGEIENSIPYFEKSLALPVKYPPALFSLITAYVQLNRLDKLPGLIRFAEENFSSMSEVTMRIGILKEKLAPYLK